MTLAKDRLDTLFESLETVRFAVIGDFCLDVYLFLDETGSEVSVETGLQTNAVRSMRLTPGGAGNVAANLTAMGAAHVQAVGVRGDDLYGREYVRMLNGIGVSTDSFLVQADEWSTCAYTKLYTDAREHPRIDFGNFNRLSAETCKALLDAIRRMLPETDLFLVNQQLVRGIHTPEFRSGLTAIVLSHPEKRFILDSRDFVDEFDGMIRKLNDHEAARAAGSGESAYRDFDVIAAIGGDLYGRWKRPVIITRGDRGCIMNDGSTVHSVPGLHLTGRIDTVGAGDSIFAGVAAGLATKLSHPETLLFASAVAGVTIQKLFQTGTASEQEIRALAGVAEYRINPELAEDPARAAYHKGSECELIRPATVPEGGFRFAIFDHDGTISTLREGWERVMEPMMVESILGESCYLSGDPVREEVAAEVREFIDKTTGVQTLVQMAGLADLVRNRGLVPEGEILDAAGYKRRYLERLNSLVTRRAEKLERGELTAADLTLRGAVDFLERMKRRGLRLYLASGTDEEDARREAHLLGYGTLFDGGIFGATGDITVEPKKVVIEKILREIGEENADRIVTFGDGPVEIRETWKRGGVGVGVASDELRRFGLNPAKRRRLILAGASVVVSDFSQASVLEELLFG